MIDEKKIEAAATAYAKEVFCHEEEQTSCMDGFIIGAKWMQQEFVKQLWHDVSEEPEMYKRCITYKEFTFEDKEPIGSYAESYFTPKGWSEDVSFPNLTLLVKRWAYLDDILPQRKEAKNESK